MKPHELYTEFKNRQDIVDLLLTKFSKEELGMTKWPECWEDLNKLEGGWYVTTESAISSISLISKESSDKNVYATEKQAKSALAYAQLSQIVAKMNDGWIPDWNDDNESKYTVSYNHGPCSLEWDVWTESMVSHLYFQTEEMAKFSIKYHKDLWLQYFMI